MLTPLPEPRRYMLSSLANASCLTPPNDASKPDAPFLKVRTKCLVDVPVPIPVLTEGYAVPNPLELLNTVLAIAPSTKLFGFGLEVGLLVPVCNLIVLAEDPLMSIPYIPPSLSCGTVPENKLVALV